MVIAYIIGIIISFILLTITAIRIISEDWKYSTTELRIKYIIRWAIFVPFGAILWLPFLVLFFLHWLSED